MSKEDIINQLDHAISTLEEALKLLGNNNSMTQCMIEGAIQELQAIITEEI